MASQTPNIGLQLYDEGDPANLADQYNASMNTLDGMLPGISNNSAQAIARLNALGITDTDAAATSKTSWDGAVDLSQTNEEDIAGIEGSLNALGANGVDNATALLNRINGMRKRRLVVFGDSWTQHDDGALPTALATALNAELIGNYGSSGAYFGSTTSGTNYMTIVQQVNGAPANPDVDTVVIVAGANNMRYPDERPYDNSMGATVNAIRSKFPNAKIYYAYSYCIDFDNCDMTLVTTISYDAECNGVTVLNTIPYLITSNWGRYNVDMLHLLDGSGEWRNYGRAIASIMSGSVVPYTSSGNKMVLAGFDSGFDLNVENMTVDGTEKTNLTININGQYISYSIGDFIRVDIALNITATQDVDIVNVHIPLSTLPSTALIKMFKGRSLNVPRLFRGFNFNSNPKVAEFPSGIFVIDISEIVLRFPLNTGYDPRWIFPVYLPYR